MLSLRSILLLSTLLVPSLTCSPPNQTDSSSLFKIGNDPPAHPDTLGWYFSHAGIQVSNITESMHFYGEVLGFRHMFTLEASDDYTVVYMGPAQGGKNGTAYQTGEEMTRNQYNSLGLLELMHAKGTTREDLKTRIRGFSHHGMVVPDIEVLQKRLDEYGVKIAKRSGEETPAEVAPYFSTAVVPEAIQQLFKSFVLAYDPDGYMLEIQPKS